MIHGISHVLPYLCIQHYVVTFIVKMQLNVTMNVSSGSTHGVGNRIHLSYLTERIIHCSFSKASAFDDGNVRCWGRHYSGSLGIESATFTSYGGAAGEITVRTSLEAGLLELGFSLDVAGSDDHFAQLSAAALSALRRSGTHYYRFIIMDPWTWAEKAPPSAHTAVRARPLLEGRENATFILDFFGNKKLAIRDAELKIPKAHVLTAFPRSGSLPWHLDPACHLHPASQCVGPRRPPPVASSLLHQVASAPA